MALAGFGMMRHLASSNTILRTIVPDDKRGRVMAYYSMAFQGIAPFGSLAAGALAAKIGAPRTIMTGGAACLCGALWFAWRLPVLRRALRPIYAELGHHTRGAHFARGFTRVFLHTFYCEAR